MTAASVARSTSCSFRGRRPIGVHSTPMACRSSTIAATSVVNTTPLPSRSTASRGSIDGAGRHQSTIIWPGCEWQRGWNENSFQTALAYRSGCTTSTGRTATCCRRPVLGPGAGEWPVYAGSGRRGDDGEPPFANAAHKAFESMRLDVSAGGVLVTDHRGRTWIEEYPGRSAESHSERLHLGALGHLRLCPVEWLAGSQAPLESCVVTLETALSDYDTGRWSLYELPAAGRRMLASRYYTSFTSSSSESSSVSRVSRHSDPCEALAALPR